MFGRLAAPPANWASRATTRPSVALAIALGCIGRRVAEVSRSIVRQSVGCHTRAEPRGPAFGLKAALQARIFRGWHEGRVSRGVSGGVDHTYSGQSRLRHVGVLARGRVYRLGTGCLGGDAPKPPIGYRHDRRDAGVCSGSHLDHWQGVIRTVRAPPLSVDQLAAFS